MKDFKRYFEATYTIPDEAAWTFVDPHPELIRLTEEKQIQGNILEIGCGEGYHTIYLVSKGFNVTSIDYSENGIKNAISNASKANLSCKFLKMDYHELASLNEKFDFIFDWRFLHEILTEEERQKY